MSKLKQVNQSGYNKGYLAGKRDSAERIAELEKQIQEIETVSDFNADRVAELEAELAEKPAYHCPKCDSWFSEGELKALAGERLTIRQVHRNGVECVHGRFLHERCDLCEGETK